MPEIVKSPQQYPWNMVFGLRIQFPNLQEEVIGTGWLANTHVLITSAHNLYNRSLGGWASQIMVFGMDNAESQICDSYCCNHNFIHKNEIQFDYGAIFLNTSFHQDYFGFEELTSGDFGRYGFNASGFGKDEVQVCAYGSTSADSYSLIPSLISGAGKSGSPIWLIKGEDRLVVGMHKGMGALPVATRIVDHVYDDLLDLKFRTNLHRFAKSH